MSGSPSSHAHNYGEVIANKNVALSVRNSVLSKARHSHNI